MNDYMGELINKFGKLAFIAELVAPIFRNFIIIYIIRKSRSIIKRHESSYFSTVIGFQFLFWALKDVGKLD